MDPVFWYPGAKWNIAEWIISFFPTHSTYLEPFFGSGAVFFNKDPSRLETINDMDGSVVNLFKVLRDHSDELARVINLTPWARDEHAVCWESCEEPIEDARRFLVRCWQSHATHYEGKATWGKEIVGG